MTTKTSLALALIILLSSTAGSAVASAVDIAHNDPMRYAIESYTAEFDVSSQEARRRLQLQTDLDAPIAEIVAVEGDRVAGFGIQHAPSFGGFVLLAGDEPPSPAAMAISDDAGGLIEITTGLRHSLDELRQALATLPEEVRRIVESTDIDIHSNAVVLGVTDQATRAALDSWTTSLPVRTKVVSEAPSRLDANVYGGRPMSTCTSGFGVKNAAGTRGVTTAAHCQDPQSVDGIALTYAGGAWNQVMDVQWHTAAGHTITDDFYQGSGYIDVASVVSRSNASGDYVCHYGKNSGNSCGYVTSIYHAPANCGGVTCDNVYVKVEASSLRACGGDSGGPWYNGNQAYGSHGGHAAATSSCTSPISYAWFTSSTYFSNIGISILTS